MAEKLANKTKVHTVYKLKSGDRVPSVTTIIGILNKPALMNWAWQMGSQGLDYTAVRDQAGDIGTLAHYLIICDLKGERPDTSEYLTQDIEKAENCLIKYWDWQKGHKIEPIMLESPLISEQYQFGGTIDFFGKIDNQPTLLEFKTGKGIYDEFFYQLAAYEQLLCADGKVDVSCKCGKYSEPKFFGVVCDKCSTEMLPVNCGKRILRIGRDADEGFEERLVGKLDKQFEIFKHCLAIYNLQKEVK